MTNFQNTYRGGGKKNILLGAIKEKVQNEKYDTTKLKSTGL